MIQKVDLLARCRGYLCGLVARDPVGTMVEFTPWGGFNPETGLFGGGLFHLDPGQWTDDISTALCLAVSLIEKEVFNPMDQLDRYIGSSSMEHGIPSGWFNKKSMPDFILDLSQQIYLQSWNYEN